MKLSTLRQCIDKFGWWHGCSFFFQIKLKAKQKFSLPTFSYPVWIRKETTDFLVFEQVFLLEEYNIPISNEVKTILDLGANVGYSAIYFAHRFEEADIICVEPESKNFDSLKLNTNYFNNIRCINAAIWNECTQLSLAGQHLGSWGFITKEGDNNNPNILVDALTITKLMEQHGLDTIDILKIDIEGSEEELFSAGFEDWLPKVRILIIELHDHLKPLSSQNVLNATNKYNFTNFRSGENQIFINQDLN